MAVTLQSDLVADVLRNADAGRARAAAERLNGVSSAGTSFAATMEFASPKTAEASSPVQLRAGDTHATDTDRNAKQEAWAGLEQLVWRQLFEHMLPAQSTSLSTSDPGTAMWRSMFADQLASTCAGMGRSGVAGSLTLLREHSGPSISGQWPYFSLDPESASAT